MGDTSMTIKAILYDLDGVLCDGVDLHEEAFLAAVRAYGKIDLSQQEHQERYAGLPTRKKLEALVKVGALDQRYVEDVAKAKQRLTQEYIVHRIHADPSRINLLQHFKGKYPQGCVTNCIKSTTIDMLTRAQLLPLLEVIVTNEDVKSPKPDPEPYIRACGLLGFSPNEVLVFEDHDVGMTSAYNAGCLARQIREYRELTVQVVWEAIVEADTRAWNKG